MGGWSPWVRTIRFRRVWEIRRRWRSAALRRVRGYRGSWGRFVATAFRWGRCCGAGGSGGSGAGGGRRRASRSATTCRGGGALGIVAGGPSVAGSGTRRGSGWRDALAAGELAGGTNGLRVHRRVGGSVRGGAEAIGGGFVGVPGSGLEPGFLGAGFRGAGVRRGFRSRGSRDGAGPQEGVGGLPGAAVAVGAAGCV